MVVLGLRRLNGSIELGPPAPERSVGLAVLDTDPLVIFLSETVLANGDSLPRRICVDKGHVVQIQCSDGQITLGNLLGQTFTLGSLQEGASPEALAADFAIKRAVAARAGQQKLIATVVRTIDTGYVVFIPELTITAFMLSPTQELFEGETVAVTVDRVFPERRWVSVRRLFDGTRLPWRERSTMLQVPFSSMPPAVKPGDIFAARIFKHGARIYGTRRSAHVFVDQLSSLGNVSFGHKPGRLRFDRAVRRVGDSWLPAVGTRMEVLAAGVFDGQWELRLRVPRSPGEAEVGKPFENHEETEATVVSVRPEGAELEAPNGQLLWLPRLQCHPLPPSGYPITLVTGQRIRVRLIGYSDARSSKVLVSQRALFEPFFENLRYGSVVQGEIEHRLSSGEFQILLDPIELVSSQPFRVASIGAASKEFTPGDRISAKTFQFLRNKWMVLVGDVTLRM